jgi:hypothetical protein
MYFFVLAVWAWNVYLFRVAWRTWWSAPLPIEDLEESEEEPDSHHLD